MLLETETCGCCCCCCCWLKPLEEVARRLAHSRLDPFGSLGSLWGRFFPSPLRLETCDFHLTSFPLASFPFFVSQDPVFFFLFMRFSFSPLRSSTPVNPRSPILPLRPQSRWIGSRLESLLSWPSPLIWFETREKKIRSPPPARNYPESAAPPDSCKILTSSRQHPAPNGEHHRIITLPLCGQPECSCVASDSATRTRSELLSHAQPIPSSQD